MNFFTDPSMASLKAELFHEVAKETDRNDHNKVTIVGIGAVGMAAAFSILAQVRSHSKCYTKIAS